MADKNNDSEFIQSNYINNSSTINLKEFSTQLFSQFSLLQEQPLMPSNFLSSGLPNLNSGISQNTAINNTDEFVDNEIYKFILNGKRDGEIPPGFEAYTKEALEIEELGKKLATFQIETDTEMSLFNTDENSSGNDDDEDDNFEMNEPLKMPGCKDNDPISARKDSLEKDKATKM